MDPDSRVSTWILAAVFATSAGLLMVAGGTLRWRIRSGLREVSGSLRGLGPGHEVFEDILFSEWGEVVQIDFLVLSSRGVFVVEVREIGGVVRGRAQSSLWTQAVGGVRKRFRNPIRQSYRHGRFLVERLGIPQGAVVPLVAFPEGTSFPEGRPEGVFLPSELARVIEEEQPRRLGPDQVDAALAAILERGSDLYGANCRPSPLRPRRERPLAPGS